MVIFITRSVLNWLVIFTSFPGGMSRDFTDKILGFPCRLIKEDRLCEPVLGFYEAASKGLFVKMLQMVVL